MEGFSKNYVRKRDTTPTLKDEYDIDVESKFNVRLRHCPKIANDRVSFLQRVRRKKRSTGVYQKILSYYWAGFHRQWSFLPDSCSDREEGLWAEKFF